MFEFLIEFILFALGFKTTPEADIIDKKQKIEINEPLNKESVKEPIDAIDPTKIQSKPYKKDKDWRNKVYGK
jgi:hypothetical protein